jgi:hypothetical protein
MWATLVISVGIVWIAHTLFFYLQETCTVKKTKDVVGIQTEKYEKMLDDLLQKNIPVP